MKSSPVGPAVSASNHRLEIIEMIKGAAITLVVAAHLVKYGTLDIPSWYATFKAKVYLFHMPLFMLMSGYVFFNSHYHERAQQNFWAFARRRCDRLLTPFFLVAILVVLGKTGASGFAYVDAAPPGITQGLTNIFIHTDDSPAFTVWYLWVLCILSLLTPLAWQRVSNNIFVLGFLALVMYFFRPPDILYLNRVFEFAIFFMAGGIAARYKWLEKQTSSPSAIFASLAFVAALYCFSERMWGLLVCGFAAAWALSQVLPRAPSTLKKTLRVAGKYSMAIYLLNVFMIGAAKALYLRLFSYDASQFIGLAALLLSCGTLLPIIILKIAEKFRITYAVKYLT